MKIQARARIHSSVAEVGYCIVLGNSFIVANDLLSDFNDFRQDWNDLPIDEYLFDGGKYRYRRFGRLSFIPELSQLTPLPQRPFFQDRQLNAFAGGVERTFPDLSPRTYDNSFLKELIEYDFRQFPTSVERIGDRWEVGIHQIRIIADVGGRGEPTPEGIHRDGHELLSMHLIRREGVSGGESMIYDSNRVPLDRIILREPLDSIYIDDRRVMHSVTPIHRCIPRRRAIRDMLIIDFDLE